MLTPIEPPGPVTPGLISVVATCYQQAAFVRQAVESCLNQTYPHLEVILIDDGSTDGVAEVLAPLLADRRFRLIQQANGGVAPARNRALALTRGEFLQILDGDDWLHPEKFARQLAFLAAHPELDGVGCDVEIVDEGGATIAVRSTETLWSGEAARWFDDLWCHSFHTPHGPLLRAEWPRRLGGFDPAWSRVDDWEFWLRLGVHGRLLDVLPEPLCYYRLHRRNTSNDRVAMRDLMERMRADFAARYPSAVAGARQASYERLFRLVVDAGIHAAGLEADVQRKAAHIAEVAGYVRLIEAELARKDALLLQRSLPEPADRPETAPAPAPPSLLSPISPPDSEIAGLVSVVIACYQRAAYVARAVASCLDQTYSHVEVIVVDDGSTDDPGAALAAYSADPRVVILRQANAGASAARNAGLARARGEFLQILDADDWLAPDKLSRQVAYLQRRCDLDAVGCDVDFTDADGVVIGVRRAADFWSGDPGGILDDLWGGNIHPVHAPLLRTARARQIGGFDPAITHVEDYDFWLRLAIAGGSIDSLPVVLCAYRRHDSNISRDDVEMRARSDRVRDRLRAAHPARLHRLAGASFDRVFRNLVAAANTVSHLEAEHRRREAQLADVERFARHLQAELDRHTAHQDSVTAYVRHLEAEVERKDAALRAFESLEAPATEAAVAGAAGVVGGS